MTKTQIWIAKRPQFHPDLGFRGAREQIDANYVGGWFPFRGFHMTPDQILFGSQLRLASSV